MNNPNLKRIGVWLDLSTAYFIQYRKSKAKLIETLDSPINSIHKLPGKGTDHTQSGPGAPYTSANENRKQNIEREKLNRYLSLLEDRLADFDHILLFGPGMTKKHLSKRLFGNKAFSSTKLNINTCDQLTENQLLEYVREFFKTHQS